MRARRADGLATSADRPLSRGRPAVGVVPATRKEGLMPARAAPKSDESERKNEVVAESVTKIGNLTRDPDMRFGSNGTDEEQF